MDSSAKGLKRRNPQSGNNSSPASPIPISSLNISTSGDFHIQDAPSLAKLALSSPTVGKDQLDAAQALNSMKNDTFIDRVSGFPVVNSAISFYDRRKQSSSIVKFGAEAIESGISTVCNPFVKHFNVSQLDDFACRQLDKLNRLTNPTKDSITFSKIHKSSIPQSSPPRQILPPMNQKPMSLKEFNAQENSCHRSWKDLIGNARSRAAALRIDAQNRIKYCLQWLRYAIAVLEKNISLIRSLISDLQAQVRQIHYSHDTSSIPSNLSKLYDDIASKIARTRAVIVNIVRSVINTICKYASAVLPRDAKNHVKALILSLPSRYTPSPSPSQNPSVSNVSSPISRPQSSLSTNLPTPGLEGVDTQSSDPSNSVDFAAIELNAHNLLGFANESYIMLDRVHTVFGNIYANTQIWARRHHIPDLPNDNESAASPTPNDVPMTNPLDSYKPNELPSIIQDFVENNSNSATLPSLHSFLSFIPHHSHPSELENNSLPPKKHKS
ncbi:hypothetical protein AYI68_g7786 [Smittium mucronatum]|uniref:Uncharacterized protein n=1 Tax=Smittium mucronatum TaxID=133383 RepID=A0A1R0GMS4_9FUNG|nr:hypothetical protein AYI68_g7786 [Smittium mucronatum]